MFEIEPTDTIDRAIFKTIAAAEEKTYGRLEERLMPSRTEPSVCPHCLKSLR